MSTPATGPMKSTPATGPKKLPFKRTAHRTNSGGQSSKNTTDTIGDDAAISLFQHSSNFLREQQRQAKEKAAKEEKNRKSKLAIEVTGVDSDVEAQILGESSAAGSSSSKLKFDAGRHDSKRRCLSSSSSDSDEDNKPSSRSISRKSSHATPQKAMPSINRLTRSPKKIPGASEIISLDGSDEDAKPQASSNIRKGKERLRDEMSVEDRTGLDDDLDGDQPEEEEDEVTAQYVANARKRVAELNAQKEARAKNDAKAPAEAIITVLIIPRLDGLNPIKIKLKETQSIGFARHSWVKTMINGGTSQAPSVLESTFFTWKGLPLKDGTSVGGLGLKPDRDGNMYPPWESTRVGFNSPTLLLFEIWTHELYDLHQLENEREKRRIRGELDEEEEKEPSPPPPIAETKLRLILKSRNHGETKLTVPPIVKMSVLMRAFRQQRKVPEDKTIEIHWDGEMLEPSSTAEDAGMEDMDQVEVHIR